VFSMLDGKPAEANIQASASNTRAFHISHFHIHVPYVSLGPILGKDLDLDYVESTDTWSGGAAFILPGGEPPLELDASPRPGTDFGVQFSGGSLKHAGAELDFGDLAPEIFPGVFLSNIRFTFGTEPVRFFGGVTLNTAQIVYVDGDLLAVFPEAGESYVVPPGLPGFQRLAGRRIDGLSFGGGGDVYFKVAGFKLPLGNAFLLYTFPGRFEFSGGVDVPLGVFSAKGEASGFVDASSRKFNTEGSGEFCVAEIEICLGVQMLLSSDGIAGCGSAHFGPFHVDVGAGYHYGGSFHVYFYECEVGPYRVSASSSSTKGAARASGSPSGFTLGSGLSSAQIELKGADGAPDVTLHGPGGQTLSTAGQTKGGSGSFAFMRVAGNDTLYVGLSKPAAGTWTVTLNPGSTAVTSTAIANGEPPPSVHVKVVGAGATRTLRYDIKAGPGQKIVFAERGANSNAEIGSATAAHGSLRFKPAFGSSGSRQLVALVQHEGETTDIIKLGSYPAPGWSHPKRPQELKLTRTGEVLRVTWKRQPGVRRYALTVRTSDGFPRLILVKGAEAKVPGVAGVFSGTVTVAGIDIDGSHGATRSARFKASLPRTHRTGKHHRHAH